MRKFWKAVVLACVLAQMAVLSRLNAPWWAWLAVASTFVIGVFAYLQIAYLGLKDLIDDMQGKAQNFINAQGEHIKSLQGQLGALKLRRMR